MRQRFTTPDAQTVTSSTRRAFVLIKQVFDREHGRFQTSIHMRSDNLETLRTEARRRNAQDVQFFLGTMATGGVVRVRTW